MELLNEIREYFASTHGGVRKIKSLPNEYPGIVVNINEEYGVAIEYEREKDILEKFSNCKIYSRKLIINNQEKKYLILSCMVSNLRYEFATVCAQFLSPGINGSDRKDLLDNPIGWWEKWKELLGNSIYEKKPYSIIAEMLVLNELYKTDKSAKWTGVLGATHDIETDGSSYEVKSTIKRYGATVTISSQYQLDSTKKLQLYFCRLEKSKSGISINDLVNSLVLNGYDSEKLEKQLHKLGYEYGTNVREEKYKILEKRKYNVDDKFPKITNLSFKNDKFPESVVQITYTIDLDGIEYTIW